MRTRMFRLLPALLAPLLAAGGCRMIDQRTFAPRPVPPDAAALATPVLPAVPDARLRPDDPASGWRGALAATLRDHPEARFAVMTPVTALPNPLRPAADSATGAKTVAAALQAAGVAPARVALGYVGTPGPAPREVWLYVR